MPDEEFEITLTTLQQFLQTGGLSSEQCEMLVGRLGSFIARASADPESSRNLREANLYRDLLRVVWQQAEALETLRKLSLSLTSSLDLTTVLDTIVAEAMRLVTHASTVNIFLYQKNELRFGAAMDRRGKRSRAYAEPRPEGLTYAVARSGSMLIVEDIRSHPLFQMAPGEWEGSIVGIPLKANGIVVGVMNLSRSVTGPFSAAELYLLTLLAEQAALAIHNALLHQLVSQQAYSDTLTGLPNRRALDERLESELQLARRAELPLCVVMMDLDGFKAINDAYGHEVGDMVLAAVAQHLQQELRTTDFLARYGGDEMTLLLPKTTLSDAQQVSEKISKAIGRFYYSLPDGTVLTVGISGGIAAYPFHASTASDLLRAADEALYRAKKHARGEFLIARPPTKPLK